MAARPTDYPRLAAFGKKYCRHVKGPLAGRGVEFESWLEEDLRLAYEIDPKTGLRVFRDVVMSYPKKHSKSLTSSVVGLFEMSPFQPENGPENLSAAGTKDQARLVMEPARTMLNPQSKAYSPALSDIFTRYRNTITCPRNDGFWALVPHDADNIEGVNPSFVSCDEYAVHKTQTLRDNLMTAMVMREQALMFTISTVGDNTDRPFYRLEQEALKMRGARQVGEFKWIVEDRDAGFLFIRCGLPEDYSGDIEDPAVWKAVNPASWITEGALRKQYLSPSMTEVAFRRKHLNQWVASSESGIPPAMWDACEDKAVRIPEGAKVSVGVDIGFRHDWSAVVVAAEIDDKIVLEHHLFQPPEGEGQELDIAATVGGCVEAVMLRYQVQRLAIDKFAATTLMQGWQSMGWPVVDFPMYDSSFCPASSTFWEQLKLERIRHNGDGVFRWHVLNAYMKDCARDLWRFDKTKDGTKKIDGLVAAIIAVSGLVSAPPNHLETHGIYI